MLSLSVTSLNTRGLNDPLKCLSVFTFLQSEPSNIFLLQECNISYRDNYREFEERWTHGQSVWSGDNKNRSSGVAVLFKGPDFNVQKVQRIRDGRLLCVDLTYLGVHLRIINVYCPAELQERLETIKDIQPLLLCSRIVILGGDFNCLVGINDRSSQTTVKLDSSSIALKNLIQDFILTDTYRFINPHSPGFTWSNGRTHSRIDFLFTSRGSQVSQATVKPVFFSDHSLINCSLVLKNVTKKGKSSWKLNVSVLQDVMVVKKFREKLTHWLSLQFAFDSIGEWWEEVKARAKSFFIEEGKRTARKKRFKLKKQQSKLQRLYTLSYSGWDVADDIILLKREMESISLEASRGLLTRSRVQHIEENEKCSRFFFRKLARPRNIIEALYDENGNEKTEMSEILNCVSSFYSDLYRSEELDEAALSQLLSKVNKKVNDFNGKLEVELSLDELTKAVNSMPNNKTPGSDGLPKEFYMTFWDELKVPLLEMYKESLGTGTLPSSLREGSITLLFKKGDKKDIKNWRPLTLLGVDRKILAKALFFRLQEVLGQIVGVEQTCVVPGRSMSDSLALVRDSYLYAVDRRLPLCISGLDLEKAFDKINHHYLKRVLVSFGFGPQLRAWINLLYNSCYSKVIVNGTCTAPLEVQAGVRQGCPLSVILFILAMEPLACVIKQDPSIHGLYAPGSGGREAKVSVYMDDLTVLCCDNRSVFNSLKWCDLFSRAARVKLNRAKSEIMYLNWKEEKLDLGLREKTERIKLLGIEIGREMETVNWEQRLPRIKGKLQNWEQRDLTITGKVLVLKAEVLASLTFLAATLPVPSFFLTALKRTMFQFIWGSKQELLKRDIMYRPLNKGGKAVPDFGPKLNSLFLCPIINAVLSNSTSLWCNFARLWVGHRILAGVGRRIPLHAPHAETRPILYNNALSLFKSANLDKSQSGCINRKAVEVRLSTHPISLLPVGAFTESQCIQVWKNANSKFLGNSHKDLAWKAVHGCLQTRAFLYRRRCTRSPMCPRLNCHVDESVVHLFWACPFAQRVWGIVNPWLMALYKNADVTDILYGDMDPNEIRQDVRWWTVINCIKDGMWKCRNLLAFKNVYKSPESVVKIGLTLVKDYVQRDKKKHSYDELINLWKIQNGFIRDILYEVI